MNDVRVAERAYILGWITKALVDGAPHMEFVDANPESGVIYFIGKLSGEPLKYELRLVGNDG